MLDQECQAVRRVQSRKRTGAWDRRVVESGDLRLEVLVRGEGPSVLMHPSLGREACDFEALGEALETAGYRAVAINPRGIGRSVGHLDGLDLRTLAADVWRVADALGLDRVFLLGHGLGERVMRTASAAHPRRVLGLVLLSVAGELEPLDRARAELDAVFDERLPTERRLEALRQSLFAPGNDPRPWVDGWCERAARLQQKALRRTRFERVQEGGTAPVLVIQGREDRLAPPLNAWNFALARPEVHLVLLPRCGHALLPEQPREIASAVLAFLHAHAGQREPAHAEAPSLSPFDPADRLAIEQVLSGYAQRWEPAEFDARLALLTEHAELRAEDPATDPVSLRGREAIRRAFADATGPVSRTTLRGPHLLSDVEFSEQSGHSARVRASALVPNAVGEGFELARCEVHLLKQHGRWKICDWTERREAPRPRPETAPSAAQPALH